MERVLPPDGYSRGLAEPEARSVQEISDLGAFDGDGERYWNLLGGGVEAGETLEGCLVREVMEEGCQRVDDPDHPAGPRRYYQSRFWARIELLRWDPQHEISERRLVRPEDFLPTLSWGSAPTAAVILAAGLKVDVESRLTR